MNTISFKKTLTQEWSTWIKDNLRKGITSKSIVAVMILNEFDSNYAKTAVQIIHDEIISEYTNEIPRFNHKGKYIQTSDRRVRIRTRMNKPCIAVLDDVLSYEECEQLIAFSQSRLNRSTIIGGSVQDFRTSEGAFLKRGENALISRIERRISEIMNMPTDYGEELQIVNYKPGQEYKPHFDYVRSTDENAQMIIKKNGQRVSTLIVYLNDVEEGGTTTFPSVGLTIFPQRGSAVYFEYCNSSGQLDPLTLHSGDPVIRGEKWIVTQWMREHLPVTSKGDL